MIIAGTALAQDFPSYYPADGFERVGVIDAVYLEEQRIVVGDVPYVLSDDLIVHSPQSYNASRAHLRPGRVIGFEPNGGEVLTRIWLLPDNYNP